MDLFPDLVFLNTLRLTQNTDHFANSFFSSDKFHILNQISLKLDLKSPITNIPALVQTVAYYLFGPNDD